MCSLDRRDFIKAAGIRAVSLLGGCAGSFSDGKAAQRPNILWIIAEDLCPDLRCYGNKIVRTPNIDRLASEGARYTNAFTTAPVCSASRSAFMTGMYQTSIGAHNHRSHRHDDYRLAEPVRVITEYFREAAYYTCNCGGGRWERKGKTDFNFAVEWPFDGTDWRQRKAGQPFFAQVNFYETHREFQRTKRYPVDPVKVEMPPYYPDHPVTRRDWADYLETVQVLDAKVGVVLKRLEEDGLSDNTIVFFFGDHGRPHVRGKQWLYDGGIYVPLIIRWPGQIKAGTVIDDLVSAIDFGPTSMAMCGIERPSHLQGQTLWGPDAKQRDYIFAARDRCDWTVDRIRCVRTKRYKYIRNFLPERPYTQPNYYKKLQYPVLTLMNVLHKQGELTPAQQRWMTPTRPAEELYDLENDPDEINNLAEDAAHTTTLKQLRGVLDKWIAQTRDQGHIMEDEQTIRASDPARIERYENQMRERGLHPDVSDEEYLKWWQKKLGV